MAQTYEVEKVIRHRQLRPGKIEYLVKWMGYPMSQNTWEPIESFVDAREALGLYLTKLKSNQSGSRFEKKKQPHSTATGRELEMKSRSKEKQSEGQSAQKYEVEEVIRDRRLNNGTVEYLVKWIGYPASQNTWEPIESFVYAKEVLGIYLEKVKSTQSGKTKIRQTAPFAKKQERKTRNPSKDEKQSESKLNNNLPKVPSRYSTRADNKICCMRKALYPTQKCLCELQNLNDSSPSTSNKVENKLDFFDGAQVHASSPVPTTNGSAKEASNDDLAAELLKPGVEEDDKMLPKTPTSNSTAALHAAGPVGISEKEAAAAAVSSPPRSLKTTRKLKSCIRSKDGNDSNYATRSKETVQSENQKRNVSFANELTGRSKPVLLGNDSHMIDETGDCGIPMLLDDDSAHQEPKHSDTKILEEYDQEPCKQCGSKLQFYWNGDKFCCASCVTDTSSAECKTAISTKITFEGYRTFYSKVSFPGIINDSKIETYQEIAERFFPFLDKLPVTDSYSMLILNSTNCYLPVKIQFSRKKHLELFVDPVNKWMLSDNDKDGNSPLHNIIRIGHNGWVRLLLEMGAHVNTSRDNNGLTPLALAFSLKKTTIIEILLSFGADYYYAYIPYEPGWENCDSMNALLNFSFNLKLKIKNILPEIPGALSQMTLVACPNDGHTLTFEFKQLSIFPESTEFLIAFCYFGFEGATIKSINVNEVRPEKVSTSIYRVPFRAENIVKVEFHNRSLIKMVTLQVFAKGEHVEDTWTEIKRRHKARQEKIGASRLL